jgi:catechol 2,3-dioxygenase-like lactoylglutathione lyase family enzyme
MARLVGINHVAVQVGDLDEMIEFLGKLVDGLELRGRSGGMAFVDLGDQFVALQRGRSQPPDGGRHFGLVVDDKEAVRERARAAGLSAGPAGGRLRFQDPWGNNIEVVGYRDVQFTKAPHVARGLGLAEEKSQQALDELRAKGFTADEHEPAAPGH